MELRDTDGNAVDAVLKTELEAQLKNTVKKEDAEKIQAALEAKEEEIEVEIEGEKMLLEAGANRGGDLIKDLTRVVDDRPAVGLLPKPPGSATPAARGGFSERSNATRGQRPGEPSRRRTIQMSER